MLETETNHAASKTSRTDIDLKGTKRELAGAMRSDCACYLLVARRTLRP
jgi:hypothetical protein